MPSVKCLKSVDVIRTPRVMQLEGLFDLQPTKQSQQEWNISVPIEEKPWHIGLIVGPSGSGKTTVARQLYPQQMGCSPEWPADKSIVEGFPTSLGIKDITGLLSSVGFSSPPAWLRPYQHLSNGEQFRVHLARILAEAQDVAVVDEFTSVVDRTVAQVGSAAVAKTVRRSGKKLVAVSCHYDVIEWLQPDWLLEMPEGKFTWRLLQRRPEIQLAIRRVNRSAWQSFKHHHYLSHDLHKAAKCFVAWWGDRPVAFASVIFFPHPTSPGWKEHRTVCLPDFQGVGIGNAVSEFVGSLFASSGKPYYSTTGNPAMIRHRARSPLWRMGRKPSLNTTTSGSSKIGLKKTIAYNRFTAGFEYIGLKRPEEARAFAIY